MFHDYVSLWTSNGDLAGTRQIFEFAGDRRLPGRTPFTQLGDEIYFFVDSETLGRVLWKTDGTSDGTTLVSSISPDARGDASETIELVPFGGRLFFQVNASESQELWVQTERRTEQVDSSNSDLHLRNGYCLSRMDRTPWLSVFLLPKLCEQELSKSRTAKP